jgi:hypothetical protein
MKTGLESLDTGAPEITYSGNEGPKSPQQMQQMQMAQLEEEYDAYVDDMLEQGIEPMSMQQFLEQIAAEAQMSSNEEGIGSMMEDPREMAANGGIMQGGVKNFLGEQETVNDIPVKWQSGPDKPATELAYITEAEKNLLIKKDIHGSLKDGPNMGPGGIMSLDSFGDIGGGQSGAQYDSSQGSGSQSDRDRRAGNFTNTAEEQKQQQENLDNAARVQEQRIAEQFKNEQEAKKRAEEFERAKREDEKNRAKARAAAAATRKKNQAVYARNLRVGQKNPFDLPDSFFETEEEKDDFLSGAYDDLFENSGSQLPFFKTGSIKTRNFFTDDVLGAGKFKYKGKVITPEDFANMTLTQRNEIYDSYMGNRQSGATDAYGNPTVNTGGGGGGGGGGQPATPPATPPPATPPGIPTDPVTGQYSNKYFIPGASNFYSNLPSTMFNPTTNMLTLANGGRANFAGGGIADLRQGYFLGKLVKSITKPFKKAFRGFKKIAKSPMGKMALLALGGYYLGGGTGLGGARMFGNTGFSMGKLPGASFFNQPSTKILSNNAIKSPIAEAGPGIFKEAAKTAVDPSGNFLTKSLGFMKDNPLATIYGTSLFSGLYTDYMNNKRKDETMADYQRRLEEERGNFAPIPVDPVQFAANGGRMGFADGGDDDDDDESFRQKALGALYQKLAMGGSAGLPPVTMQTEGQDTQSFGDDESTGMPQATPTMQNQMPMRQPMMDPRMQNQMMMAQRGNPMMNRGMMSMQQPPRIMAQEGGMMDMGGMEKDYRNEGGFVPIGEYERKDDVPARLSKNEFVFTADAVRNAGGGDIDRGAEIMENMMENLEAGGKISEASQGLKGAREMFATQQRLGEVL